MASSNYGKDVFVGSEQTKNSNCETGPIGKAMLHFTNSGATPGWASHGQ